jgi:hypothetical protein
MSHIAKGTLMAVYVIIKATLVSISPIPLMIMYIGIAILIIGTIRTHNVSRRNTFPVFDENLDSPYAASAPRKTANIVLIDAVIKLLKKYFAMGI